MNAVNTFIKIRRLIIEDIQGIEWTDATAAEIEDRLIECTDYVGLYRVIGHLYATREAFDDYIKECHDCI